MANFDIDKRYHDKSCLIGEDDDGITCVQVIDYPDFDGPSHDDGYAALINPDELVVKHDTIEIEFDYPLTNPAVFEFKNAGGFTRKQFFRCVYEGYNAIYAEENAAVGPTDLIPGMLNRQTSEGPHGIWGHVMGDLFLEGVIDKGDGKFELEMGS